jgi:adenylosuccinate synthase
MQRAFICVDLGLGDSGKGSCVDFLVGRESASLVVRFGGGPNCSHSVIRNGIHHASSQFGSGVLAGAHTHLSRFVLIDPLALRNEATVLHSKGIADPFESFSIDPRAVIITPWHMVANQSREAGRAGKARHGTVGVGLGEARYDELHGRPTLRAADLKGNWRDVRDILFKIGQRPSLNGMPMDCINTFDVRSDWIAQDFVKAFGTVRLCETPEVLAEHETVIFEPHQGLLLDERHGFAPYHTWTNCTFENAERLVAEAAPRVYPTRIGVIRTYFTRHGVGPFPTEDNTLNAPEPHNATHPWMGPFRVGHFDAVLAQYALRCAGPIDYLAITHADTAPSNLIATSYETPLDLSGDSAVDLFSAQPRYEEFAHIVPAIAEQLGVPLGIVSHGPTAVDKEMLVRALEPTSVNV